MSYRTFEARWIGKRVDPDHVFNFQCVDLILQWLREEDGIKSGVWGNAIDYWVKPTPTLLKKYYKIRSSAVKRGDIVVLRGLPGNPYGHIGIATGVIDGNYVEILEQNGATGTGTGVGGNAIRKRKVLRSRIPGILRRRPLVAPVAKPVRYNVVSGDTLSGIAHRHGTTWQRLVDWNKATYPSLVSNPNFIAVGWKLRVK